MELQNECTIEKKKRGDPFKDFFFGNPPPKKNKPFPLVLAGLVITLAAALIPFLKNESEYAVITFGAHQRSFSGFSTITAAFVEGQALLAGPSHHLSIV